MNQQQGAEPAAEAAHPTKRPYVIVFLTLAILTAIEVWVGGLEIARLIQIGSLLGLAAGKAVLVALFYMHLRYDQRVVVLIAASPLFLISVLIIAILPAVAYGR